MTLSAAKDGGALANMRMDAHLSDRVTEIASFPMHPSEYKLFQINVNYQLLIALMPSFSPNSQSTT